MYPVSKSPQGNSATVRKVIGAVVVLIVCIAVTGCVIYAIKKMAESDGPAPTKPLRVREFTANKAVGRHGPHKLYYKDNDPQLSKEVTVKNGIQYWTVPETGVWILEARGASGADGILKGGTRLEGGWGAQVRGKFILKEGEVLKILIGQEGTRDFLHPQRPGGGGGGTFVVKGKKPILIAGGGGGGGVPPPAALQSEGQSGRSKDIRSRGDQASGVKGSGGNLFDTNSNKLIDKLSANHKVIGGAGGGFVGNGIGLYAKWGGKSFLNGGTGGEAIPEYSKYPHGTLGEGGFGGGGAAGLLPGGGGGYSGGGVSGCWLECSQGKEAGIAEGGSSLNKGVGPHHKDDVNKGDGRVYATFVSTDESILALIED